MDDAAPGWDAIDAALAPIYADQEPVHRAPMPPLHLGGALQGISAYAASDHWHLVTYGLSELYQKESDDPEVSGWGYELTIRVPRDGGPPDWAFNLLHAIAQQTQQHGVVYGVGHRIDTGHEYAGPGTGLTAVAMTEDPQLGTIRTPNGALLFLQVVGVTGEELAEMKASSTALVLDELRATRRLLVTSPRR